MAHPSDVQPAQQDEPSVEHCGDRRLLRRREVIGPGGRASSFQGFRCQICALTSPKNLAVMAILLWFSFLGYVDKLGVAYEAPTVATGFGAYLAQVSP